MNGLRWTLGIITGLMLGGFTLLVIIGGAFRGSFGASDTPLYRTLLPLGFGVLVLASLILPERRMLLHAVAAGMLLLIVGCGMLVRTEPNTALAGIGFAAAWLVFYWQTVRA